MSENKKKTSSELAQDNLTSLKQGIDDLKKIQKEMGIENSPIIKDIPKQKTVNNISYEENQINSISNNEDKLKGISGWLGVFAFSLIPSIILNISIMTIMGIEVIDFLLFVAYLYSVYLFFMKMKNFIPFFIILNIVNVVCVSIVFHNAGLHLTDVANNILEKLMISTIIWSCYLLTSKRVKNTLVN